MLDHAGYRIDGGPPYQADPVHRDQLGDGVLHLDGLTRPVLRPRLGTLLRRDIPADATPGTAYTAIAGHLLAVELVDGADLHGVVYDERLLPPDVDGGIALHLGRDTVIDRVSPEADGVADLLGWLAATVGGLTAGQLVFAVPTEPGPTVAARPGVLRAHGPLGSTVLGEVSGA